MSDERVLGIVFDKDGTLTDYQRSWGRINLAAARCAANGESDLERRLLEVGGARYQDGYVSGGSLLAAADTRDIAKAWVECGAPYGVDGLVRELDAIFQAGASEAVSVTDVDALFRNLMKRGVVLGVATSDSEKGANSTLEALGVCPSDVFVAGYDSGHGRKPQSGMVAAFCRHHGLDARNVAVVGDNLHDIRMGRAAECLLSIGVLTGASERDELEQEADHVLESVEELEPLLDELRLLRAAG